MTKITTREQSELIVRLKTLAARRARDEVEIRERHAQRAEQARAENERQRKQATSDFETRHGKLVAEYQAVREAAFFQYESKGHALAQEEERQTTEAREQYDEFLEDARLLWQQRQRDLETESLEGDQNLKKEAVYFQQQCDAVAGDFAPLVAEAQKIVRRRCPWPEETGPRPVPQPGMLKEVYLERVPACLARARERVLAIQHQPAARFLEDGWPVLICIFTALALGGGAIWFWSAVEPWGLGPVAAVCVLAPLILAFGIRQMVRPVARNQTLRIVPEFQQAIAHAEVNLAAARTAAEQESERARQKHAKRREKEFAAAEAEWERTRHEQATQLDSRRKQAAAGFQAQRKTLETTHERKIKEVEAKYPPQIEALEHGFEHQTLQQSEAYRKLRAAERERYEREWNQLVADWTSGLAEFQTSIAAMNQFCETRFPAWEAISDENWRSILAISEPANGDASEEDRSYAGSLSALRFGRYSFSLGSQASAVPSDEALVMPPAAFELPAVLSYPECPSLLLEAEGEGRDVATRLLQDVMLRLLTSFPPGKVRFTIIDPVGLGQNFSAFMHLADYDERLVHSRIWTESTHIHQRLTDLTEHMENVIQKYLRNEFASIQEYNAHAGEVAEPFQILVLANFPAGVSEEAARRLVSIAKSGARCGVYTLISTDGKLKLPRNFDLADLETQAATLVWDEAQRRFAFKDETLNPLPLTLEEPPGDDRFTDLVRAVGKLAKDNARVEVPFESVVPVESEWWTADSRSEIAVPLGRAGAKKLQYMRLGKGTSQHVLISGKTGSGKSTLLNAMITNLALHYSPQELQFFLIDFKKGVEFKAYAALKLPHARVIAIESEREFGMSVLERLDQELKRRGDLFRQHGVQDVKGYRGAQPDAVMPRILLVIDEFQEFFTSDDRISHDSALLLDRLVRQGRAFGIHVLLGSQTLAGAYSLARSTIGQMAVRIALQCSESDAHLILSEDNTAARLLSRPGEAIYNDANGLFEGNHPFQVVWLSDQQREGFLRKAAEMADERQLALPTPIVFEGNVAADPADNDLLRAALEGPLPEVAPLAPRAWLGAAVAIKDPTDAVFRRQGGSNLLVVGQQEELALGILCTSLVALAAQLPPARAPGDAGRLPTFHILDGTRAESPQMGAWKRLTQQLALDARVATPRDAADVIRQLAEEVDRRLTAGGETAEPLFLVIDNLARFRDLKKSDDFSFDEDSPGVGKQFNTLLREGPNVGVHALVWCDSYSNLNRWLDRQTLRDFDLRVLFQMSAADSSNLMDSPAASKLGAHLAIAYSEEQGVAEKFRPYGLPRAPWLAGVATRLSRPIAAGAAEVPQTADSP